LSFQGSGYHAVYHPVSTTSEKYIVSFVYRNLSPPLAKLAVCNVVFPDFCSIDRSPVLMHHLLLLITAGGTRGACSGKQDAKNKYIYLWHPASLNRCFASARSMSIMTTVVR